MNLSTVSAYFTAAVLVLFIYSGLIKWLPFPFDPTILFGALLLIPVGAALVEGVPRLRGGVGVAVLIFMLFFTWYAFTAIYSASATFWMRKELILLLDLMALAAPLMCFRTVHHFRAFNLMLGGVAAAASLAVLGMYAANMLPLLLGTRIAGVNDKVPDYLALGTLIGCGVLLAMARPKWLNLAIAALGLAAIMVLAARGPMLFAVLLIPLSLLVYRRRQGVMPTSAARYLLVLIIGAVAFTQWEGAESSLTRFSKVFSNTRDFDETLRVDEFAVAGELIGERPFLGVGLGAYGISAYGEDADAYPHNLFLEAFAEAGVPGVMLFTASMIIVLVLGARTRRIDAAIYLVLFTFLLLNFAKSGGFVSARDLYMMAGVLLAYLNAPAVDDQNFYWFGLERTGPRT